MRNTILLLVGVAGLTLSIFQNCSRANFVQPGSSSGASSDALGVTGGVAVDTGSSGEASLVVRADPAVVEVGASTAITAVMSNLPSVSYSCAPQGGGDPLAEGQLDPAHGSFALPVTRDLACDFSGTSSIDASPVTAHLSITVACGAQIKTAAGTCEDFSCKSVIELTSATLDVPARTEAGECYAFKIMSGLATSPSSLTTAHDPTLLARSHDSGAGVAPAHPYLMGSAQPQFTLRGARTVKLAGGVSATAPIKVDNFVLAGVFPVGSTPDPAKAYRVTGSTDSGILDAQNQNTGVVEFDGIDLPVQSFATGGTSSIAPIDISAFVTPNVAQQLDVRALDCGGTRALSDIYILFQ